MRRSKSQASYKQVGFESRGYSNGKEPEPLKGEDDGSRGRKSRAKGEPEPPKDNKVERVYHCLQIFKEEINIGPIVMELQRRLDRKTKKRTEESNYKAELEEHIRNHKRSEPEMSSKSDTLIESLKSEAGEAASKGDLSQARLLRTAMFNESIEERERKDRAEDELRRLLREVDMLAEEIAYYDKAIEETTQEHAVARNLQLALQGKTEAKPTKRKGCTYDDCKGEEDKSTKKPRGTPETGLTTPAVREETAASTRKEDKGAVGQDEVGEPNPGYAVTMTTKPPNGYCKGKGEESEEDPGPSRTEELDFEF